MDNYAVIGNPIAHSKSPQIHSAFAQQQGLAIDYQRILAEESNFTATVKKFKRDGGIGLNITVPFKVLAYEQCSELNDYARIAKAVNTISFDEQGNWVGTNTDGIGLLRDLQSNLNTEIKQKRILVVGAGGATRGILLPLLELAPASLVIANRTVKKAHQLVKDFSDFGPITQCEFSQLGSIPFDIIINATSASLENQVPPINASTISSDTLCYDLAYSDSDTAFLQWARAQNAGRLSDGLGMLIEQAAESYFIWRGFRPDTGQVFDLLRPRLRPRM